MMAHFRTLLDLKPEALDALLNRAIELKKLRGTPAHPRPLEGKTVAILLEKASTRTRISFEVGVYELGGLPLTLVARDTQLGRGEPLEDTAKMLSGYVHGVAYRTFGHDRIEALAANASIPVINALSDDFHPCQLLADLQTIREETGKALGSIKVAYIGDGNNMAHSWMLAAAQLGFELRVASPEGFEPSESIGALSRSTGRGTIKILRSPEEAVSGVDVVTTDVWASMGQEDEAARRREAFKDYCVTEALMAEAASDAIFLHCLPAHRGEEVAAEVIDGPQSRVFIEAENRLHAQKALMELLLG